MSEDKTQDWTGEWTRDLAAILDHLEESQLDKLCLVFLTKIHRGLKEGKSRGQLCHLIQEHYGPEASVLVIQEAMEQIPRKDATVQDLLRPHLDRLKDKENREGNKRSVESGSDSEEETVHRPKGRKKKKILNDSDSDVEEEKKCKQEVKILPWMQTVADVMNCAVLKQGKVMLGKLVQKSGLRKYQTKEKQTKSFFYVSVADHTGCLKVMVYGAERYSDLQPGQIYCFRNVLLEERLMKVTKNSTVSQTTFTVEVPEQIEVQAETLIYPQSPVCSIADAKSAPENSTVSVEGTITEIGVLSEVKLKAKRRTTKPKQDFWISDGSDKIQVCLWGGDVQQLRGHSDGDWVRVINVRTKQYYDNTSLNSTFSSRIIKMQDAAEQDVSIEVIGVVQANQNQTQLDAVFNQEVAPFSVQSRVLAKALGIRLEGDFKDQVLKKIPFSAQAQVKGSTINEIQLC